jgi:hypothetical protein
MIITLNKSFESRYGFPIINKIDTLLFTTMVPKNSCSKSCADICCSGGATMDIETFNKLLKHKDAPIFKDINIIWEGYDFQPDEDYSPGGKGCYTRFDGNRCMFQNKDWGCSIHTYCLENKIDVHELKFFTCCMFPVEVNNIGEDKHILTAGYELRYPQYVIPCKQNGDTPVYEIAKNDIEYYYGNGLIEVIEKLKNEFHYKK